MARPLTITAYGNAQVDTAQSKSGGASLYLDGSADYLEVDNTANDLDISGAWTVEAWVRMPYENIDGYIYTSSNFSPSDISWIFSVNMDDPNQCALLCNISDGQGNTGSCSVSQNLTLTPNTFFHVAWTCNGSGTLKLWLDGTNIRTTTGNAYTNLIARNDVLIGDSELTAANYYKGHIDEFRVSDVERYTSTFTPSARHVPDNDTLLLIHFDGADGSTTFTDDVGVQGSSDLNSSLSLTAQATDNPSMVFLGNDAYTWDNTDTWTVITGLPHGGQDQWRAAEIISSAFEQTVVGGLLVDASASLSVSSAVDAKAGVLLDAASSLTSTTNLESDAKVTRNANSILTASTLMVVSADMTRNANAELDIQTALTAEPKLTVDGRTNLVVQTDIDIDARILKLANIDLDNFASMSVTAAVDVQGSTDISASFSADFKAGLLVQVDEPYDYTWDTIDPDTWEGFVIDRWEPNGLVLFERFSLTTDSGQIRSAAVDLASQFDLEVGGGIITVNSADLDTEFVVDTDASLFRGGVSDLLFNFDLSCTADNFNIASAELDLEFATEISAGTILDAAAVLDGQMNFEVTADNFNIASADLSFAFAVDVNATLIPSVEQFELFNEITINAIPSLTLGASADLDLFTAQLAAGERLVNAQATLNSEFAADISSGVVRNGSSELSVFGFVVSEGRLSDVRGSAVLGLAFDTVFIGDLRLLESDLIYRVLPELRSIGRPLVNYRSARTITTRGGAALTSVQAKFGSGSVSITNIGDLITVSGTSDLYSGDFTAEMWIWNSNLTQLPNGVLWDIRTSASNGLYVYVSYGSIGLYEGITGKGLTSAGFVNSSWNHIAIVRNSNNLKIFVNGVQKISATVTTTNYSSRTTYVAGTYNDSIPLRGYIDELRISNTARYTTAFTEPISPFSNDEYVRALVHFNGSLEDDVKIRSTVKTDTEIPRETRQQTVLPDSRQYQLKSETCILEILQETRQLDVEDLLEH